MAAPAPPTDADLDSLIAELPLERKVRLLSGADQFTTWEEPAIGLRSIVMSDGPVGPRGRHWDERETALCLPSPTALAATWDPELVQRLGGLLAAECRRRDIDVLLAPTINLHRSPLGGRHFECFSEDPLLTALIAAGYVRGLQENGVAATPKHYVANDSETERFTYDARIDERTLRELYLAPFEHVVRETQPWLVMAAYNAVNGTTMTESDLLEDPLSTRWGFDGVVVSDWHAARSTEPAGRAWLDLSMPGPDGPWGAALVEAVRDGRVEESDVDRKLARLLRLAARVGALDGVAASASASAVAPDTAEALLREAATASFVLVANRNDALPLDAGEMQRIAIVGAAAAEPREQGGGSATVFPPHVVTPLAGLRAAVGDGVEIVHAHGPRLLDALDPIPVAHLRDPGSGEPGLRLRLLGAGGKVLAEERRAGARLVLGPETLVDGTERIVLEADLTPPDTGEHRLGIFGTGSFVLRAGETTVLDTRTDLDEVDLATQLFQPPEALAAHELAAGEPVRLTLEHPFNGTPVTLVGLGWVPPAGTRDAEIAAAAELAASADAAIVCVGTNARIESEGADRSSLALPDGHDDLVAAVTAANPRTIVVVNAGGPVELPWRDDVAAVLLTWFGGQEYGAALADVLLGATEPGGRLPTTWAAAIDDLPVRETIPTDGRLDYGEGLEIGYRAWARAPTAPAYPFGHGLGYTTWAHAAAEDAGDGTVRVSVRNTGTRAGRTVVQAYLARPDSALARPELWLAGWASAAAEPGETVTVDVALAPEAFRHWGAEDWETEPGAFTVRVGASAVDLPLETAVQAPA